MSYLKRRPRQVEDADQSFQQLLEYVDELVDEVEKLEGECKDALNRVEQLEQLLAERGERDE